MKMKMLPQEERPVEKAEFCGVGALSNIELVAILLGSGTREKSAMGLAEEIISASDEGISFLADCTVDELKAIKGVGSTKATRVLAGIELGRRVSQGPSGSRRQIHRAEDVANFFMRELRHEKKENFKAVLLNAKGQIISVESISVGDLTMAPVHPREGFRQAVKKSAAAVIFVHNHPSGDAMPSEEDIEITRRLMACGTLLGIKVVDHIVIGDNRYRSIAAMIDSQE